MIAQYKILRDQLKVDYQAFYDKAYQYAKERHYEYSANGRPLVTVEKSTQYAKQVHLTKKLNTVGSPF